MIGHFDGYEIWTNFSNKGDSNPRHDHGGWLSGVIYYKNHGHPYFNDLDVEYEGKDGMILFPSNTVHSCKEQTEDKERITLAFNLILEDMIKNIDVMGEEIYLVDNVVPPHIVEQWWMDIINNGKWVK